MGTMGPERPVDLTWERGLGGLDSRREVTQTLVCCTPTMRVYDKPERGETEARPRKTSV